MELACLAESSFVN
ncbi:hypothetical protein YPPY19_1931, partial [Yersinia pestis PY-19]